MSAGSKRSLFKNAEDSNSERLNLLTSGGFSWIDRQLEKGGFSTNQIRQQIKKWLLRLEIRSKT